MGDPAVVTEAAPGKLNPYLRVLRRRDDGFHEIETIVLPLDLADRISIEVRTDDRVALRVVGPRGGDVPHGEENLVMEAVRAFRKATRINRGVNILLEKHVPVAAGLGGGSSDAAATLRALNRLAGRRLDEAELQRVAAQIGSDVPALIPSRPVVVTGWGELVEPIDAGTTWWALVTFDAGIRASDAYRWWDRSVRRLLERPPPIEDTRRALAEGDAGTLSGALHNSLEPGVLRRHPSVAAARLALIEGGFPHKKVSAVGESVGAVGVIVSGSGPTVAGLCRDQQHASRLAAIVRGTRVSTLPS